MDHWQNHQTFDDEFKYRQPERILASTSGNVQLFPSSSKHDGGKLEPYQYAHPNLSHINDHRHHPIPAFTLGSNDHRALARRKLLQNSIRRRMNIAKPYLAHPLYQKYRNRPRKDVDKAGNTIWPDVVENAFQNAIVHIPPMGKNKRSQHGRPHGRNELIAEWIFHETGGQMRGRKQVSSHLQVLDKMFKGVPEWQVLNKKSDDTSLFNNSNGYYTDSIADMVTEVMRIQRSEQEALCYTGELPEKLHLDKIDFDMWVGLPQKMDDAVHRYTKLNPFGSQSPAVPLESIYDWRSAFPDLCSIIDTMSATDGFDIVMLEVSLSLMEDFPPESSKLGINLGLSYAEVISKPGLSVAEQIPFNCTTQMYRQGNTFRTTQESKCLASEYHTIKPPFESKWWAHEFTMLTDMRRRVQDDGMKVSPQDADEFASKYLQDLTIMQQISINPNQVDALRSSWLDGDSMQKRATILLWQFSLAPAGEGGTATWRKVMPPPNRTTTNSPWPASAHLPAASMTLDSTLQHELHEDSRNVYEGQNMHSLQDHEQYPHSLDEELCQDGYVMVDNSEQYNPHAISPTPVPTQEYILPADYGTNNQFGFGLPMHSFEPYRRITSAQSHVKSAGHETFQQRVEPYWQHQAGLYPIHGTTIEVEHGDMAPHGERQHALQTFNSSTHEMLQEQLRRLQGDPVHDNGSSQSASTGERSRMESLGAATDLSHGSHTTKGSIAMPDANKATEDGLGSPAALHSEIDLDQMPTFVAPIAVRPPFQQHHSFAGIFPTDPNLGVDTPRHDFARMLENMEAQHEESFDMNHMMGLESQEPFARSYSQPSYATFGSRFPGIIDGEEKIMGEDFSKSESARAEHL